MSLEIDEEEPINDLNDFNEAMTQKRHKQLLSSLKEISDELKKNEKGNDLRTLETHFKSLNTLIEKLSNAPKPEKPVVNISNNNDDIVESFQLIADKISKEISLLKDSLSKPTEWTWTITRNRAGFIEYINAKSK
jgi:PPE-repeat protein